MVVGCISEEHVYVTKSDTNKQRQPCELDLPRSGTLDKSLLNLSLVVIALYRKSTSFFVSTKPPASIL